LSEQDFQGRLHDARIASLGHQAKCSANVHAIHEIRKSRIKGSIWIHELGMIEGVEGLEPELEALRFRDLCVLQKGHIPVIEARAMEETPGCVSNCPESLGTEKVDVEVRLAGAGVR